MHHHASSHINCFKPNPSYLDAHGEKDAFYKGYNQKLNCVDLPQYCSVSDKYCCGSEIAINQAVEFYLNLFECSGKDAAPQAQAKNGPLNCEG